MMGNDRVSLSVIIPVYNATKYLNKCVDSLLLNADSEDIEIIIIDDGSTDDSGRIADRYSESDPRICVVHTANRGPSEARNDGLRRAKGTYVFFCDADDMVDSEVFGKLIKKTVDSDSDLIVWSACLIDDFDNRINRHDSSYFAQNGLLTSEETINGIEYLNRRLTQYGDYSTVVWLAAYRKGFLLDNGLLFVDHIMHEDELWVPQVFLNARSVSCVEGVLYFYRIHSGSRNSAEGKLPLFASSVYYIYPYLFEYCENNIDDSHFKRVFEANLTRKYLHRIFEYDLIEQGYGDKLNLKFLWNKAGRLRDLIRVMILLCRRLMRKD